MRMAHHGSWRKAGDGSEGGGPVGRLKADGAMFGVAKIPVALVGN
jgi:hypothetical protein